MSISIYLLEFTVKCQISYRVFQSCGVKVNKLCLAKLNYRKHMYKPFMFVWLLHIEMRGTFTETLCVVQVFMIQVLHLEEINFKLVILSYVVDSA